MRFSLARQNFEKRRLSCAVRSDQAVAITLSELDRNVLEQNAFAELNRQTLCTDHDSRFVTVSGIVAQVRGLRGGFGLTTVYQFNRYCSASQRTEPVAHAVGGRSVSIKWSPGIEGIVAKRTNPLLLSGVVITKLASPRGTDTQGNPNWKVRIEGEVSLAS